MESIIYGVEYATLAWVDWFSHRCGLGPIGNSPLAELEQEYYGQAALREQEALKHMNLHRTRGGSRAYDEKAMDVLFSHFYSAFARPALTRRIVDMGQAVETPMGLL